MITNEITVSLIEHMGDDKRIVDSARVSLYRHNKNIDEPFNAKDEKLLNYLAEHQHTSPFEHCTATFYIACPMFIARQIMRHRTFSYNEVSRRYTSEAITFYQPSVMRKQAVKNLQASDGELAQTEQAIADHIYTQQIERAFKAYNELLACGVARELARAVLPHALNTQFYMSGNLLNWVKFIKLRDSEHAQLEAQIVAQQIKAQLNELYPESMKAWGLHD